MMVNCPACGESLAFLVDATAAMMRRTYLEREALAYALEWFVERADHTGGDLAEFEARVKSANELIERVRRESK